MRLRRIRGVSAARIVAATVFACLATPPLYALPGFVIATGGSVTQAPDNVGSAGDLVLINCATGRDTILRRGTIDAPCFSPDGGKIAFVQSGRIYTINADGSGLFDVIAQGGTRVTLLNWAGNNYLYWSPSNDNRKIYRVAPTGGTRELVHALTDSNWTFGDHLKISRDATRAAWWYAGVRYDNSLLGAVLTAGSHVRYFGKACMTTVSPSGLYVCHNTSIHGNLPAHVEAYVRSFDDTLPVGDTTLPTPLRVITEPEKYPGGYFNRHRFSQHSDSFVTFYTVPRKAWVCNAWTDSSVYVGDGLPFDYFPGQLGQTVTPAFVLSKDTIVFNAVLGRQTSTPAQITVSIVNETPTISLATALVETKPAWLTAAVQGSGIVNTVNLSSITQAGPLSGTVQIRVPNAYPLTRSYTAILYVRATDAPPLASIDVTPDSAVIARDESVRFSAVARDQYGNPLLVPPSVSWSVNGGGAIDSQGVFRASVTEGGPFTVTATSQGISGSAKVSVRAKPIRVLSPNGGETFSIDGTMAIRFAADTQTVRSVNIEVSVDEGLSWIKINGNAVSAGQTSWGNFAWVIPDSIPDAQRSRQYYSASAACLVRVSDYNPTGIADESDGVFSILDPNPVLKPSDGLRILRPTLDVKTQRGHVTVRVRSPGAFRAELTNLRGQTVYTCNGDREMVFSIRSGLALHSVCVLILRAEGTVLRRLIALPDS